MPAEWVTPSFTVGGDAFHPGAIKSVPSVAAMLTTDAEIVLLGGWATRRSGAGKRSLRRHKAIEGSRVVGPQFDASNLGATFFGCDIVSRRASLNPRAPWADFRARPLPMRFKPGLCWIGYIFNQDGV